MKRILLFVLTNILILTMLAIVVQVFGIRPYLANGGLNLTSLLIFAAVLGFGGAFISLAISKWMAKVAYGVQIIDPARATGREERWLVERVHDLSRKAGLTKMPEVGVYDSPEVNAFATGPSKSNSLVAVSSGLMHGMDEREVEGVLAHEVAHIANGDMVTMTLLQGVINTFVIFLSRIAAWAVSRFVNQDLVWIVQFVCILVFQIVFSILGSLVVMAFSRHREFKADAGAAELAGKDKMIAALRRLQGQHAEPDNQPALATMKISGGQNFLKLFSSHPPLEERIAALENAR